MVAGESDRDLSATPLNIGNSCAGFQPREVKEGVAAYLEACRERDILEVRIIHGKGTGALQRTVHAMLSRMPEVVWFRLAAENEGGWGATLVTLAPLD